MASDSSPPSALALYVKDVHKFYGTGRGAYHALRALTMEVPYGTIYGLLGASGCGKTTLLRCVLGRLPIQSGQILILGKPPGARGHGVPGKDVGYMPQEEALALKFTIKETMYYFGLLFGMNLKFIKQRLDFLNHFLNLPDASQLCQTLSGGEKRRVSLAAALLHEPPLLILDEPTVGVDALLRAKIWDHLLELTSSANITIIITTHYIEEARQAHGVGLMRSGRLLAQAKPDDLIRRYNAVTLEDVFLKLSEEQELQINKKASRGASIQQVTEEESTEHTPLLAKADTIEPPSFYSGVHCAVPQHPRLYNIAALTWKEALKFVREPFLLFFVIINPSLQLLLLAVAYGQNLTDIKVYYTNNDHTYNSSYYNTSFSLGSSFMSHIDDDTLDLELAGSRGEGIKKVKDGKAWGYFSIPANYSQSYVERLHSVCGSVDNGSQPVNLDYTNAAVELVMDVTSQQIYFTINQTLNDAADMMKNDFLRNASIPEFKFTSPLKITEYVFGESDFKFVQFTSPGLIVGLGIGVAISLTATNLIVERASGLFDRSYVAGVNVIEVIVSQVVAYSVITSLQAVLLVVSGVYIVDVEREGNIALVMLLTMLVLMCGVSFGLIVSAYIKFEDTGVHVASGIVIPILVVGGVFWPTESLEKWLKTASRTTPITYPVEAIRDILLKGYGLGDESVYLAFIIVIGWTVVFLLVAGLGVHIRRF